MTKTAMSLGAALKSAGMTIETINGKPVTPARPVPATQATPVKKPYCCPYCAAGERCGFLGMR